MEIICYINNIPMNGSQLKLFDMYERYINNEISEDAFINFEGYGNTLNTAKQIYEKVMNNYGKYN